MIGKYNAITIYSQNPDNYSKLLEKNKLNRVNKLVTACAPFTPSSPRESERVETNGKGVFDILETLTDFGIYLVEQREN